MVASILPIIDALYANGIHLAMIGTRVRLPIFASFGIDTIYFVTISLPYGPPIRTRLATLPRADYIESVKHYTGEKKCSTAYNHRQLLLLQGEVDDPAPEHSSRYGGIKYKGGIGDQQRPSKPHDNTQGTHSPSPKNIISAWRSQTPS
ncbi:hypothetical protein ASF14_13865 [Sphingomonas sp. Leaf257]|nr:hypothetical protein ASF14_13865 [Sphingomonas sp. Leaf257]